MCFENPTILERIDDCFVRYLANFNYKNYISQINLNGKEKVLEVGCGGGNLSRFLAEKLPFGELVCIDNSDYWINKARKRLERFDNVELIREDILDFERRSYFDLVVVHYVLHDLTEKEKAAEVLKDSLRQKGKIYIREPTRKNHGMASKEIAQLMEGVGLKEIYFKESYLFILRKVCVGVYEK